MVCKTAIIIFAAVMYTSYAYLPLKRVGFFKPFLLRRMSTSNKFTIGCPTSNHIEKLGEKLSTILESSDVLFLQGDLGSGKTTLSRGIIRAKFQDPNMIVTSPSYLLDNTYRYGENDYIHHMDLYRLPVGYSEMGILGIPNIFNTALCLVEWPNRLQSQFLPQSYVDISISIPVNGSEVSGVTIFSLPSDAEKNLEAATPSNTSVGTTEGTNKAHKSAEGGDTNDDSDSESEEKDDEVERVPEQLRIVSFTFYGDKWMQKGALLPKLFS